MNIKKFIASALIATGILIGWKKGDAKLITPLEPGANEVWIRIGEPNPIFITVPLNTTVKWTNMDNAAHTVASTHGLFSSNRLNPGNTYSFKFTSPGKYFYHCPIHTHMTGEVIVK